MAASVLELSLPAGRMFELETLGYYSESDYVAYHDFQWSRAFVMRHQPDDHDPQQPAEGVINEELFEQVRALLPHRWKKFLRLYIALGSAMDYFHGVDAFFFLNGVMVTIDVTLRTAKGFSADVLITPRDVDVEKGTVSPELAKGIARQLMRRYQLARREEMIYAG